MSHTLVTGGNGFLGGALVAELFARGDYVTIFDINCENPIEGCNYICGSVHRYDELLSAAQRTDELYHLSCVLGTSELLDNPGRAVDTNISGTLNALRAGEACGIKKFFFPASPGIWLNPYSVTKACAENFCRLFGRYGHLDVRILRWLNAYGPGQHLAPIRKVVPIFVIQALFGYPLEVWGDGNQRVDLLYVDDVAFLSVEFVKTDPMPKEALDVGLHHSCTVNELAKLIIELTGSKSVIRHLPMRRGEDVGVEVTLFPSAASVLGFNTRATPLLEGLSRTVMYYRNLSKGSLRAAIEYYYGDATPSHNLLTREARVAIGQL
jgi:UDP-glucose 4-epimerase